MSKGKENMKGSIIGKLVISIVAPIVIIILIASSYFAIVDGMVEIIEGFLAKLADVASNFIENPGTYLADAWATISNAVDLWWSGGNDVFDPNELGIQGLAKPSITVGTEDFKNIKNNIDIAQVNRTEAGLEDYMLKVMLLSYYRSIYLSDYNIYMELTDDEAKAIEALNNEADISKGKYPCPFELILRCKCKRYRINWNMVFKDNRKYNYRDNSKWRR